MFFNIFLYMNYSANIYVGDASVTQQDSGGLLSDYIY